MIDARRIESAVDHLASAYTGRPAPRLFAGPDGFLDEIIHVVDKRFDAANYTKIRTITEYANRVASAAGRSTNIEWVVEQVKAGGNGPLMSEAYGRLGGKLRYVGCVGWPEVDPLFNTLQAYGEVVTIAPAAITLATEFEDGKIMNGKHDSLKQVTWANLLKGIGGEAVLDGYLGEADVLALVNWTMLPHLNEIFRGIRSRLENLGKRAPRFCFFDLCDPAKRTKEDLREALVLIGSFSSAGTTAVLGLNEKESLEVCGALDLQAGTSDHVGLLARAERIAKATGVTEVVIHPTGCAVAWNARESGGIDGPLCAAPKLTTGAGDHFNGGYMFARSLGLAPSEAVVVGVSVSGFYVREGRGPSVGEIGEFTKRWTSGSLDPWRFIQLSH